MINGRKWSGYQVGVFDAVKAGGQYMTDAVAGSGKTTTIVEALKYANDKALMVAFNKSIATEMKKRTSGLNVDVSTIHALGRSMLAAYLDPVKLHLPENASDKYWQIVKPWVGEAFKDKLFKEQIRITKGIVDAISLCRLNMVENDAEFWQTLAHHGIFLPLEVNWSRVQQFLAQGNEQAKRTGLIDFDDMVYLPVFWAKQGRDIKFPAYSWVVVDEAQDLNRAQRETVLRCMQAGGNFLGVGDPKQAIYGFAGADSNAFWNLQSATNSKLLPLSICYRCPESHLDVARQLVPQIEAAPYAIDGVIIKRGFYDVVQVVKSHQSCIVLARRTKDLMLALISLIRSGVPAKLLGRSIGKKLGRLIDQIEGMDGYTGFDEFVKWSQAWLASQIQKLTEQHAYGLIPYFEDDIAALFAVFDYLKPYSGEDFKKRLEAFFSDDEKERVLLMTIHRAKGLEHDHVVLLHDADLPLGWQMQQAWEATQEQNLIYVALTRAKRTLTLCTTDKLPPVFNDEHFKIKLVDYEWGETFYV